MKDTEHEKRGYKLDYDRDTGKSSVQIIKIDKDIGTKTHEVYIYDKDTGWKVKHRDHD